MTAYADASTFGVSVDRRRPTVQPTYGRGDARFEFLVDVASRDEFAVGDAVDIGERKANEVEVGCCISGPVSVLLI